jgi:negative regulator of sigma E activity
MEWKKNLFDYQAPPPPNAWEQIAAELAQDAPSTLRAELYQYEAAPPPSSWDAVVSQLNEQEVAPTKIRKIWYQRPWTVAAAAAIAAVIFGIGYNNNKSANNAGLASAVMDPISGSQASATTSAELPEPDPLVTAMKNKDNNYIYFTTSSGEAKRISYKLQHLLPAIKENKANKTLSAWTSMLESSPAAAGGSFFDIVEMVKTMEKQKN